MIKFIAFDLFGTVFDLSNTPKEEIRDYINHIRQPIWKPLVLPSSWENLELHPDSYEGISRLYNKYSLVTCSNAPYSLTEKLLRNTGLNKFMDIVDISLNTVFKPHPRSYLSICEQCFCEPEDVLMVTGNAGSPDIDGALNVEMNAVMIRQPGCLEDINALADYLGC